RCSLAAIGRRSPSSAPVTWPARCNNPARLDPQEPLWATLEGLLREQYSPEQIAGLLPRAISCLHRLPARLGQS
ncbi:MAG: hypothetical protein VB141_06620, partial [Burkholderia gladioli]